MNEPAVERPYLRQLDLVRAVASIGVVATHSLEQFGDSRSIAYGAVLAGLHATREVFFFVSALVLSYRYAPRRPFPLRDYTVRRATWIVAPYVVWTAVYLGVSYARIGDFSVIAVPHGSVGHDVGVFAEAFGRGVGHLYYVAVLLQFFVVFPLLVRMVQATRHHVAVMAASVILQVWLMSRVTQDPGTNREIWNYQLYLVLGVVVGLHFEQVAAVVARHRRSLAALAVAAIVGVEAWTVGTMRSGTAIIVADDPFQSRFIVLNLSAALGLYLLGCWWSARRRASAGTGWVAAAADNSYGVYLSHGVALNLLLYWGWRVHVGSAIGWPLSTAVAVFVVWTTSAGLCSVAARTPLARAVGRRRRPLRGSPATGRSEWRVRSVAESPTGPREKPVLR